MIWSHSIVSRDPYEIVSLDAAKAELDVTFSDDDWMIQSHISAAISWVENYLGRFLVPVTIDFYCDSMDGPVELPFAPVQSVSTVKAGGNAVLGFRTVPGEAYLLLPPAGTRWPSLAKEPGAYQVRYVVGYPAGSAPPHFVQAVKLVIAIYYEKPTGKEAKDQWDAVRNMLESSRRRSIG